MPQVYFINEDSYVLNEDSYVQPTKTIPMGQLSFWSFIAGANIMSILWAFALNDMLIAYANGIGLLICLAYIMIYTMKIEDSL